MVVHNADVANRDGADQRRARLRVRRDHRHAPDTITPFVFHRADGSQIKDFRKRVGGVEHIIMMTRQGLVTHAETEKSFTLAAKEVLPQLQDLPPIDAGETAWLAARSAAK